MVAQGDQPDAAPVPAPGTRHGIAARRPGPAVQTRRWRSADLFGPAHEIEIEHGQVVYRLNVTALGKLILTK